MAQDRQITITLPDGSQQTWPTGTTPLQVAESIGPGLAKAALSAEIDGRWVDLGTPISEDASLRLFTFRDAKGQETLRHSTAHVMAQAVQRLWPEAKVTIGPAIDDGFYYDFDVEQPFTPEDLARIEEEMARIIGENHPFQRSEVSRDEAHGLFAQLGEPYKIEILEGIPKGETVSIYKTGDEWCDLCRGPHVPSTGRLGAVKLLSSSGAYWRGDEHNRMLQRIYGTCFPTQKELRQHLELLEQARERDHRKVGRELDLFMFHPVSPAAPFFFPHGAIVYNQLVDYVRGLYRVYGYDEVITPQIFSTELWHRSGHYENYQEHMYFTEADERELAVKPMNCPGHAMMYAAQMHSYRELPVRYADFGRLHRFESSGVTQGLTRVRSFVQDDAHIFCTPDQIATEIQSFIDMLTETYQMFGFADLNIALSLRPEKRVGAEEIWDRAEGALAEVLRGKGVDFTEEPGGGAFYGPKIDFKVRDALRREWQLGTVQLDFSMPERFGLEYVTAAGTTDRPVMVHRAMLGSIERFFGILVEHCGGAFPVWLAPVQVAVLPIADRHSARAEVIRQRLEEVGARVVCDHRSEKTNFKVAEAEAKKIPYILVIGDRETESEQIAVRARHRQNLGTMELGEFAAGLVQKIRDRSLGEALR